MTSYYKNKYFPALSSCAIIAPALKGSALSIKSFSNFKDLTNEFGKLDKDNPMVSIAKVLFLNNVSKVYCLAPSINSKPTEKNYEQAFKILDSNKDFYCVICDSNDSKIVSKLIETINTKTTFPKIAFIGAPDNFEKAKELSSQINNNKLILASQPTTLIADKNISSSYLTAAALASCVVAMSFPTQNLTGSLINGLELKDFNTHNVLSNQHDNKKLYNAGLSYLTYFKSQLQINKIISSSPINSKLNNNINNLLVLDSVRFAIINLVHNIKSSPSFKFLSCRSLIAQIILLLSELKDINLISDFLIPQINITSSINIFISIKPVSLINQEYLDTSIVI